MEEMARRHNPFLIPQYIFPYLKIFMGFKKIKSNKQTKKTYLRNGIVTKYIVVQISRLISLVDNLKLGLIF